MESGSALPSPSAALKAPTPQLTPHSLFWGARLPYITPLSCPGEAGQNKKMSVKYQMLASKVLRTLYYTPNLPCVLPATELVCRTSRYIFPEDPKILFP